MKNCRHGIPDEWGWSVDGVEAAFRLGIVAACFAFAGLDYWSWLLPVLVALSGAWWHGGRRGDLYEAGQCVLASFLLAVCAYGTMEFLVHLEEKAGIDFWPEADLVASGVLACGFLAGILSVRWPQGWRDRALSACRAVSGRAFIIFPVAAVFALSFLFAVEIPTDVSKFEIFLIVSPGAFAALRVLGSAAADGFVLARCGFLWVRAPAGQEA